MAEDGEHPFSAGEQGLGYIYQSRFALLKILSLPEDNSVLIEKDDDLEILEESGKRSLASLKHKAAGEALTDLATDFWKSVRVWLLSFDRDGRRSSNLRFFLFTTAKVPDSSFLRFLLLDFTEAPDHSLADLALDALNKSKSQKIIAIKAEFQKLDQAEREDFLSRIVIFDNSPRITEVPDLIIDNFLRTIRRESRRYLFERLEGWWNDVVIHILSGVRTDAIYGYEVSDKLSALAEEYRSDNLPITFRSEKPEGEIDVEKDPRLFVEQLRCIGISASRIQSAIIDYYRAFAQRSSWARENLLVAGEIEEYEDRLVDEWSRYKEVIFEKLDNSSADEVLIEAGRELYRWAEFETERLRIRERVTEPYVVRGGYHILANVRPRPRVYWHPRFLERIEKLLEAEA